MTTTRHRKKMARERPPAGTTLQGRFKGETRTATIVEAQDLPAGKAVEYEGGRYTSLSAAAKAIPATPSMAGCSGSSLSRTSSSRPHRRQCRPPGAPCLAAGLFRETPAHHNARGRPRHLIISQIRPHSPQIRLTSSPDRVTCTHTPYRM